jgi:hypothetical protein
VILAHSEVQTGQPYPAIAIAMPSRRSPTTATSNQWPCRGQEAGRASVGSCGGTGSIAKSRGGDLRSFCVVARHIRCRSESCAGRLETGHRHPALSRFAHFGSCRGKRLCRSASLWAPEPTTQHANLQVFYGSDGTRTRDLRRDSSVRRWSAQATPSPKRGNKRTNGKLPGRRWSAIVGVI